MAYMRVAGVEFFKVVYQVSAVILFSINSALNSILYSSLPEKLMEKFSLWKKNSKLSASKRNFCKQTACNDSNNTCISVAPFPGRNQIKKDRNIKYEINLKDITQKV